MKKMTKKKKLFRKVTALAAVVALGASLAGCLWWCYETAAKLFSTSAKRLQNRQFIRK